MTITVGTYQTDYDEFKNVREIIKKSKKGVVVSLDDLGTGKIGLDYCILMTNLDSAIEFYYSNI